MRIWLRRITQGACLGLFLYLFFTTVERPINRTEGPLKFFFQIDPLIAINNWLAWHTLERAMLLSLVTLALTVLFGHWFCGWICPLGAIHDFFTSLRWGMGKRMGTGGFDRWQRIKYYVLGALLAAALAGVNLAGWLDPISLLFRSLATAVYPAFARQYYYGSLLIGALFLLTLAANFLRARFWCRYVCPLGALLGVAGKRPLVRLKTAADTCDDCRLCGKDCPGGAGPRRPVGLGLDRRTALAAGLGGLGGGLLFRAQPLASGKSFSPLLVRPPGAVGEREFLARCVRCGECMKVCPTNAIHPASLEGGLEAAWTPVMKMDIGYCEYECTLCSQVCPTQAIRLVSVAEKQKLKIGLAYFDKNKCLPYAYARTCIVCEEHCPTPKKAIWFEEAEVVNLRGERLRIKQPRVDADLCIGCGICENKCPIKAEAGIRVFSGGETRNPENRILLGSTATAPGRRSSARGVPG